MPEPLVQTPNSASRRRLGFRRGFDGCPRFEFVGQIDFERGFGVGRLEFDFGGLGRIVGCCLGRLGFATGHYLESRFGCRVIACLGRGGGKNA